MLNVLSNCLYCCGLRLIARENDKNIMQNIDDTHQNEIKFAVMTNQPQFVKRFFRKYPQFFQNYCFCLHRKVEPMTSDPVDGFRNGTPLSGANTTPIIPVSIDPNVYVAISISISIFTLIYRISFFIWFVFIVLRSVDFNTKFNSCDWWNNSRWENITHLHAMEVFSFHSRSLPLSFVLVVGVHLIEIISIAVECLLLFFPL